MADLKITASVVC